MSIDWSSIGLALAIFLPGFLVVGPNILAIIGTSMAHGRAAGTTLALGTATGSFLWATLASFGAVAFLSDYALAMTLLRLFGAAYLAWMAVRAFRSALSPTDAATPRLCAQHLYRRGLLIQMTNPKAALQWVAIVSLGLGANPTTASAIVLILLATLISVVGHVAYARAFSATQVTRVYARARRAIDASLGGLFAIASWKLATMESVR